MRARVQFEDRFPNEQRAVILRLIEENEWIIPSWIEQITIEFWQPDRPNISMRTILLEEYRRFRILVCPEWLLSEEEDRASDLRHEFIHIVTDPLYQVALKLVNMLDDDSDIKKWASEELRHGVERSTVDMEYALQRFLDRPSHNLPQRDFFHARDSE